MSSDTAAKYDVLIEKSKKLGSKKFRLSQFPFKNRMVIGVLRTIKAIVKHGDGTYSVNGHMKDLTGERLASLVSHRWPKQKPRNHHKTEVVRGSAPSPSFDFGVLAKEIMTVSSRLGNIESFLFRIAAEGKVVA